MLQKILKISILTCLLFLSSTFAKVQIENKEGIQSFNFQIDNVVQTTVDTDGGEFTKLNLEGADNFNGVIYKVGYPEIPVLRFFVNSDSIKDIRISSSEEKSVNFLNREVYPSQESLPKMEGAKNIFKKVNLFKKGFRLFPSTKYSIEKAGSVRGVKRYLVTLHPVQYDPQNLTYITNSNFDVNIKNVTSEIFSLSKDLFVFIIPNKFDNSRSLQKYIDFKEAQGFETKKIIVKKVNRKTPDEIRKELKKIWKDYKTSFKYALIVGDSDEVPGKKASHISGTTDHYYRAIDTLSYETDINGPDIGLGRITVSNENELSKVIDKFLKYQNRNYRDTEWLKRIAFVATTDKYEIAEGSHNHAIENYMAPNGFYGTFPENYVEGGDKLYGITYKAKGSDVVAKVREGRSIVNYSGHGSNTSWAGPSFSQSDVRTLDHEDALPFVISNACITGKFTIRESFAETWIKHPQGAIMFWGSMDSTYWDEDDILEKAMYQGIFRKNNRSFDEITQYALSEHWKHYGGSGKSEYYWETYHTFGDASIKLQTTFRR